ncbi:MAG: alkaline phosphatase D family protein, partial [Betaproteobacteria bacterium]|nr:alkaline phosphatase D family protein [Betaproteobacteria bacterium]
QGGSAQVENCAARLDPALTLLGDAQEKWLLDGLAASRSTWNVLAQQTLMAQLDRKPGPGQKFWTDGWDGYPAARGRITNFLAEKNINNTVVIGGDVHANFVADLKTDFDDPRSRTVASEFCGTSISAQTSSADKLPAMMPDNPHIHLAEGHKRGYVVMELGKSQATAELRVIDSEKIRDSKISTLAKFAVAAGKPGVQKI